jgi:hypothetical protein
MDAVFSLKDYAMSGCLNVAAFTQTKTSKKCRTLSGPKSQSRRFVNGPIDLSWILNSARLPGKTPLVGLALWYRKGFVEGYTVKVSGALWRDFGVSRQAANKALDRLEKAGLVQLRRVVGKNPEVMILLPDKVSSTTDLPMQTQGRLSNESC